MSLPKTYVAPVKKRRPSKAKGMVVTLWWGWKCLKWDMYTQQRKRFEDDNEHRRKHNIEQIPMVGEEFRKIGRIYLN